MIQLIRKALNKNKPHYIFQLSQVVHYHLKDLIYHNGDVRLFNGSEWLTLGLDPQIIEGIDNKINEVASSIPTKTSQLQNDSGFITVEDVPDNTKLVNDTKTRYIDGNGNIYEYFSEPTVKWVFSDGWNRELKVYSTTATSDGT